MRRAGVTTLTIPSGVTQGLSALEQQAYSTLGVPRIQPNIMGQYDWLLLLVINIIIFIIFVFILQYCWNNSVKNVFKLTDDINLLDAFLLLIVSRILFN